MAESRRDFPNVLLLWRQVSDGMDELGVLLCGSPLGAYWLGSQLGIHRARQLVPDNGATTLQVAPIDSASMLLHRCFPLRFPLPCRLGLWAWQHAAAGLRRQTGGSRRAGSRLCSRRPSCVRGGLRGGLRGTQAAAWRVAA